MPKQDFILEPTRPMIDHYIRLFDQMNNDDESALNSVFDVFNDNSLTSIYIKSIILNDRYSAGLNDRPSDREHTRPIAIDVHSMSETLFNNHRECENTESVIEYIESIGDLVREQMGYSTPYSFLSKYLYFIYRDNEKYNIPIYDGYSKGMIYYLSKKKECNYLDPFPRNDITTYRGYHQRCTAVLKNINKHLGADYSTRNFDKYLWMYGKALSKGQVDGMPQTNIKI